MCSAWLLRRAWPVFFRYIWKDWASGSIENLLVFQLLYTLRSPLPCVPQIPAVRMGESFIKILYAGLEPGILRVLCQHLFIAAADRLGHPSLTDKMAGQLIGSRDLFFNPIE